MQSPVSTASAGAVHMALAAPRASQLITDSAHGLLPKASSYLGFLQLHQLEGNTEQKPQLAIILGKECLWEVQGQ